MPSTPPPTPLTDTDAALGYVRDLQRDGRLLLRHVARRTDRSVAAATAAGAPALEVLTADPHDIVHDPDRLELLAGTVDTLSRQAAPATASTIRLTSAYLRLADEGGEPPPEVKSRCEPLRLIIKAIMLVAGVSMLVALGLLAHVDDGRRASQQLAQVKEELRSTFAELETLPDKAWTPTAAPSVLPLPDVGDGALPMCPVVSSPPSLNDPWDGRPEQGPPRWRMPTAGPEGARAKALCSRLWEAAMREQLVFLRLQSWNCRNYLILELGFLRGGGCGVPPGTPPALQGLIGGRDWDRTEMRTTAAISMLTGFVLPLLMGCIGGCAYVLRRLDQKLSESTLEVRDGWHAGLRVLLATMMGGLLGAVWSGDEQVQLGGYALSLAAVAFFVGFALEAVFTVIEAMVEGVAGKLRAPPPASTVVVQAPRAVPVVAAERPAQGGGAGGAEGAARGTQSPVVLRPAE